jgi:hypothetical protein
MSYPTNSDGVVVLRSDALIFTISLDEDGLQVVAEFREELADLPEQFGVERFIETQSGHIKDMMTSAPRKPLDYDPDPLYTAGLWVAQQLELEVVSVPEPEGGDEDGLVF